MARWVIYKKDGSVRVGVHDNMTSRTAVLPSLEYSGEWMGESFVTLSFGCSEPIDFSIGDYVLYRGEKYVINYDPTVIKKAHRGTYGDGFVYENVKFNSLSYELTDARFLDYVLDDNNLHYTSLPTFGFYSADIDDYADRLQANMNRYCQSNGFAPEEYWQFLTYDKDRSLQRGCSEYAWEEAFIEGSYIEEEKKDATISVSNQSIWDALSAVKNSFGLNFIIRGRQVIIGAAGLPTSEVFRYGKDNGLHQIERTADSEQQIITKLYAYGNSTNLPLRYYADLNSSVFGVVQETVPELHKARLDLLFKANMFTDTPENGFYPVTLRYNNVTYQTGAHTYRNSSLDYVGIALPTEGELLNIKVGDRVYFEAGVYPAVFPSSNKDYSTSNLPNNMSVNTLMLPGFPNVSLYDWVLSKGGETNEDGSVTWHGHTAYFSEDKYQPYILSTNYKSLGIREGIKTFDNAEDGGDIYPTIENTGYDEVVSADVIEDNGVFREGATIPEFAIVLKNMGSSVDLRSLRQEGMAISMKDGYCGGREFSVKAVSKNNNGTWNCRCDRSYDNGLDLYFPYSQKAASSASVSTSAYQVQSGDHFVLTGIEMPSLYVELASERLLDAALTFLDGNDYTRYTYRPEVDEIHLAHQHDVASQQGQRSIYDTLKEGDVMLFEDTDLNIDGSIFIDSLRIKEYGNRQLPTYEITLRNDKQVGTIDRIQEQISSLTSAGGNGGAGGGVNAPQTRRLIEAYGADYFLSKRADDTARGIITFEQGIKLVGDLISSLVKDADEFSNSDEAIISEAKALSTFLNKHGDTATGLITFLQGIISNSVKSNDFTSGDLDGSGFGVWVDENGKSHAEFDVLSARMKAIFTELEIKKLRYSGGNLIFSAAGGEIIRVENFSNFWRCYFKADDGEEGAVNLWDTDDLAMCRTFNLTSSGSTALGNRYYWRRVVNAATRVVDGETLAYIDLSKSIYDTSVANDEPAVGDMVVQVGNRDNTKADRQNVILLEVVGTNAPSFKGYTNINTFSLSNDKLVFQWSPNACQVRSDRFRLLTSSNGSVSENPIVNDRGAWVSGATYAYYDRVSYNGNLWLCTNQSGTSGTPSVSSDWLLQVSKGEDGKAFNIKDKVNSVSDLPATGEEGDAYMVGDHLYVWSTIYNTYWNGWGQQDAPFSGFVSSTPMTLTAGQKYKVVIDAVTTQSEFVDVVPVRSSFGNALYLAKGAEMTSGGAQATETEAFLLYPSGNGVNAYYQNTGLGNYASITIDVYEQSVGWRDMGTLRGVDGVDAYNIQLSTDNIVFDTDVDGQAILSGNNEVSVALYKGGEAVANPTISIGTTTGCTASASGSVVTINAVSASSGQVVINVSKGSDFSGSKTLKFACITYQTMKSFAQEIVEDSLTNYATSERVGTLEGNVTTLSSSVSSLQQTSTNLTARVANNEGNISSLDQRASSLETSVKSGLVNLFSDGERERSSNQGTLSIDVSSIVRSTIGYAQATYSADVMLLEGASATISLSLVVNGANKGTTTYIVQNDGAWHRISVSYAITASDVQTISSAIVNVLFAQVLEQGEVPLSYHVRHVQAQLGGIATEWQPSQADYETKFVQTPTQAGILAYTQGQEVASIGVYSDGKVKLTGEEIQLEGNITANGNVRIDENGMIHAKGGVFDGYIRSSVAKDLWYETESYGFYYHPVKSQLNLMFTYDGKVLLPSDPEYIGARVLIVGGLTNSGEDAKIDICPARSYSVRCYEFYPEGTGSDSVTWASSDNTVMSVKAPWAQATNWQIYDPVACRTILGLDMSGGSYIRMENGTIELLGVPCYKGTSDPIYKLKEDNSGTIEGRKLREDGTLDTTTTQMYSRDGEVTEWTQWVIINRSVKNLTVIQ